MSGGWVIFIIVLFVILVSMISFYCHFFGDSGGRSFELQSNDSKPRIIMYRKKCSCSDKFKGLCKYCEVTDDFVGADGGLRIIDDFADYGGGDGFEGPSSPTGDPIRGFLGGQSQNQNQHQSHSHGQQESHGQQQHESSGMMGGGGYDSTDMSGIYQ